jgi:hypothetical protein
VDPMAPASLYAGTMASSFIMRGLAKDNGRPGAELRVL